MAYADEKTMLLENRIKQKFDNLARRGEKGLITFVTAGDPDLETTVRLVLEMEKAGADIVELGVPYSDPLADGPVIQKASLRALKNGTALKGIFGAVREVRKQSNIPLILMTYYNPVLRYGLAAFAAEALTVGVDGVIVPDLPVEEAAPLERELTAQGLYLIPLVAPTSGAERIKRITAGDRGFVYCVSLTGVTGIRQGVPPGLEDFLDCVRRNTANPLAVGFGVSHPEQAREIAKHCDAVIVGSALVKTIEEYQNSPDLLVHVKNFVHSLKEAI
ncbi:tryptophan synthase subunit alpha [Thermincola ferriacetica]|uniref:Tryptophan synthase alpha chain n=1 Tax=Thermincola ferriacetica TaxID=281456 RepID=A0A0L6VYK9_9FIRM|nr:tryptophan synthase subunit alpha [Thermincola ferriacetica]KNZ68350.1 tryptophan synthase subunit alpha [Thermincola ferriacetica]